MSRHIRLFFLSGLLFSPACTSKVVVTKIGNPKTVKQDGIVYALPKTEIVIAVPVKKTTKKPGAYAIWSPVFFPEEDDAATEASAAFSLEAPSVSTRGIPDLDELYMISVRSRYLESKTMNAALDERGVFVKIDADSKSEAADFILGSLKAAASLAVPLRLLHDSKMMQESEAPPPKTKEKSDLEASISVQFPCRLTQEESQKRFKALTKEQKLALREILKFVSESGGGRNGQAIRNKLCDETEQDQPPGYPKTVGFVDFYIAAKENQKGLEELRETREQLLRSLPQRERLPGFEEALARLDKEIQKRLDLVFGTKTDEVKTVRAFWAPKLTEGPSTQNESSNKKVPLFELASEGPQGGVCASDAKQVTVRIPNGFKADAKACAGETEKLHAQFEAINDTIVARVSPRVEEASGARGFRYRIPRPVTLRIHQSSSAAKLVFEDEIQIAQFGAVLSLPASSGGRTTKYNLELYPETGALKTFIMGSDPVLIKSLIADAEAAGKSLIEAEDDLQRLKRQRELLEEQRKILEERNKLQELKEDSDS